MFGKAHEMNDSTINPTDTYVLDDESLAELEESRLTGIVRALSEEWLEDMAKLSDDEE